MERSRKEILKKVNEIFEKHHTPFFLSCGTCLGIYRDGKFIDWDYDVDVGILEENLGNFLSIISDISFYLGQNPQIFHLDNEKEALFNWTYYEGENISMLDIAIYFLDETRNIRWKIVEVVTGYWIEEFDARLFNQFQEIIFDGLKFNLPCPVEEYLLVKYGETWRNRIKEQWTEKYPSVKKYVKRNG